MPTFAWRRLTDVWKILAMECYSPTRHALRDARIIANTIVGVLPEGAVRRALHSARCKTVLAISSGERFLAPRAARSSTTEFYTTLRTRRTQGKNISPVMETWWSRAMACGGSTEPWEVSLDVLAFVWWLRGHGRWIYSYRNLSRHDQGSDEGKDSRGLGVRVVMRDTTSLLGFNKNPMDSGAITTPETVLAWFGKTKLQHWAHLSSNEAERVGAGPIGCPSGPACRSHMIARMRWGSSARHKLGSYLGRKEGFDLGDAFLFLFSIFFFRFPVL